MIPIGQGNNAMNYSDVILLVKSFSSSMHTYVDGLSTSYRWRWGSNGSSVLLNQSHGNSIDPPSEHTYNKRTANAINILSTQVAMVPGKTLKIAIMHHQWTCQNVPAWFWGIMVYGYVWLVDNNSEIVISLARLGFHTFEKWGIVWQKNCHRCYFSTVRNCR